MNHVSEEEEDYILKSDFGFIPFGKFTPAVHNDLVSIGGVGFQNSKGSLCQPPCCTTSFAYNRGILWKIVQQTKTYQNVPKELNGPGYAY